VRTNPSEVVYPATVLLKLMLVGMPASNVTNVAFAAAGPLANKMQNAAKAEPSRKPSEFEVLNTILSSQSPEQNLCNYKLVSFWIARVMMDTSQEVSQVATPQRRRFPRPRSMSVAFDNLVFKFNQ
jgi:hypothetical protein